MDPDATGQCHIDQGMGLIHVATTRFDQTSPDIESLLLTQAKPLCQKCPATGIDIHRSSAQDKNILNPGILHQCREWTQGAPGFVTDSSWIHSGHEPRLSGHGLSVIGGSTLRG